MIQKTEAEIMQNWKGDISNPIVSICSITYNHEIYIAEALDSFLMQKTDFPFEIVIDDDYSSDKTAEVIKKYKEKFPNIMNINLREYNIGMMKNITGNMRRAKGEYIALCEGDDYWTDSLKLHIQIKEMKNHPKYNMSFHPADELIVNESSGIVIGNHFDKNKIFTDIEMFERIQGGFAPTASLIIHRKVIDNLPSFFITAPVADMFIQFLSSTNSGALFIARKMSIYRRGHPQSYTSIKNKKTGISVESLIKVETDFTLKFIQSLEEMANFLDYKYKEIINQRISERLFMLSILYLKNNMDEDFKKMVVHSYKRYKSPPILYKILYDLRFTPSILRILIKLREILLKKMKK